MVVVVWISIDFKSILKDFNTFFEYRLIFAWFLLYMLDVQAFSLGTGGKIEKKVKPDTYARTNSVVFFSPDTNSIRGVVKNKVARQ